MFQYKQPKAESDIKCSTDCMVRAVTITTGLPYKDVHKVMYKNGWRASYGAGKGKWELQVTDSLTQLGFKFDKVSFPGVKGQKRMTAKKLCKLDEKSTYILRVAGHVVAQVEGKYLDTWDSGDKCVYYAWKITS